MCDLERQKAEKAILVKVVKKLNEIQSRNLYRSLLSAVSSKTNHG